MATEWRVIDWNLGHRADTDAQWQLIDRLGWDVLLLQEVHRQHFARFEDHAGVGAADFAFRHRSDRQVKKWCNGIVVRKGIELLASAPMANVPSPGRTLCALLRADDATVEVASLANPPTSSGWNELKAVQADTVADRWASRTFPLIAGLDRNGPRVDHPTLAKSVWSWEAEVRLFGPEPKHDMRDVLRTHLDAHRKARAQIATRAPDGPLGLSFMRGKGKGNKPARYDAIYASPEFEVLDVRYVWDEAVDKLSDHGAVWAHLRFPDDAPLTPAGKSFKPRGDAARQQVRVPKPG